MSLSSISSFYLGSSGISSNRVSQWEKIHECKDFLKWNGTIIHSLNEFAADLEMWIISEMFLSQNESIVIWIQWPAAVANLNLSLHLSSVFINWRKAWVHIVAIWRAPPFTWFIKLAQYGKLYVRSVIVLESLFDLADGALKRERDN